MTTTILLIDDEKDLLIPVKRSLKRLGYTVHTAESGEEGWRAITETMYDLVISDLVMPGIDGCETCRRIKAIHSDVQIVMVSALSSDHQQKQAFEAGADDYEDDGDVDMGGADIERVDELSANTIDPVLKINGKLLLL